MTSNLALASEFNTPTPVTVKARLRIGLPDVRSDLYYGWDVLESLRVLEDKSVQCVMTGPPYWRLRSYLNSQNPLKSGELGLESTPEEYVENLVLVFREVRRVLKDRGTLWVNLGDTYVKKELQLIPSKVADALSKDGWFLRMDNIWRKLDPMGAGNIKDRTTSAHEHVYMFVKNTEDYAYYKDAISEDTISDKLRNDKFCGVKTPKQHRAPGAIYRGGKRKKNCLSVWDFPTSKYKGSHPAPFPPELAERGVLAGSAVGDTVLDCFSGSGTTGLVANYYGRDYIGIDLNQEYLDEAMVRIRGLKPWKEKPAGEPEDMSVLDLL